MGKIERGLMGKRRRKKSINGWMLRKRGIFKRWARATVKVKSRVNYTQMPEKFTAKRPPRPDRRGTVLHEVPPSKRLSIGRIEAETRKLEIQEEWTGYRHHGLEHFKYKELRSRGRPPYFWERIYFKGDEVLFIQYDRGVHKQSVMYRGLQIAMSIYNKGGVRWDKED